MAKLNYVMLVDDDFDDQELFQEALMTVDDTLRLHRATDGVNALEHLNKTIPPAPDVIFLDLNMPKLNGLEFLARVRTDERLSEVPVVIYSTSNALEHKQKSTELGAIHYMVKQNSFRELCSELRHVLEMAL